MGSRTIGIIANPASGKDVRRLVARASVFDNREKSAIIRRALEGALNTGARNFAYLDDSHNIAGGAFGEIDGDFESTLVPCLKTSSALDTTRGALSMRDQNPIANLILGGDGTSRAFVKGWREAALLPLSTGTNNVFPILAEATIAGAALGVLACGGVSEKEVLHRAKIIDIQIEGEAEDIALIDAVVTKDQFIGSRALLNADVIERIFLTRAEPTSVGMTSVGGLVQPLSQDEDFGMYLILDNNGKIKVRAPIAPGLYENLRIKSIERVGFNEPIEMIGPCILALDGEREREVQAGQAVKMSIGREGPSVLDVRKTMELAANRGFFT